MCETTLDALAPGLCRLDMASKVTQLLSHERVTSRRLTLHAGA